MGHSIIKLPCDDKEYYLIWSSITNSPITYGMSHKELKGYLKDEYGNSHKEGFEERLKRVEQIGTSSRMYKDVDRQIEHNCAGGNEECLTKEQIVDVFIRQRPRDLNDTTDFVDLIVTASDEPTDTRPVYKEIKIFGYMVDSYGGTREKVEDWTVERLKSIKFEVARKLRELQSEPDTEADGG